VLLNTILYISLFSPFFFFESIEGEVTRLVPLDYLDYLEVHECILRNSHGPLYLSKAERTLFLSWRILFHFSGWITWFLER